MKLKVYKIAVLALICLTAVSSKIFAQQSSSNSSSSAPAAPATPAAPLTLTGTYNLTAPPAMAYSLNSLSGNFAPLEYTGDLFYVQGGPQDTVYQKKMKKLQEQMAELRKQMSTLNTEERAKSNAEMSKRMAARNKELAEKFKKMDNNFSQTFNVSGQKKYGYNYEKNNADLDKKVASGEAKMKTKAYTKSYTVDGNDKLTIKNSFGRVTVNVWNKNEVKVDVEIKAYADDDDKAKELLDQVIIKDSKSADSVSFITSIGEDKNNSNNWTGSRTINGKTSIKSTVVNYTVYMPSKNPLSITNTFGGITLPEFGGKLNIKSSFGNFTAKALTNPDNLIKITYGKVDIESLIGSDLHVSFGSLNLTSADNLNANIQFSPAKIGKISNSGKIKISYGDGLQIGDLSNNLKTLTINSSFAPVKLTSLANDNANFEVTTGMGGGFTYDSGKVNMTTNPDESQSPYRYTSTKTYKGHIGKGSADKVITIKSTYGSVKFDQ